ncbi:MAG: hypothetical protein HN348_08100, partial [Proteobacteria bacterium]|nr:hypothetical protein [Pseudomonadota bacterium]
PVLESRPTEPGGPGANRELANDRPLVIFVIAAMVLVVSSVFFTHDLSSRDEQLGEVRDVDLVELRRLIEQGRLSDHNAMYWQMIDQ